MFVIFQPAFESKEGSPLENKIGQSPFSAENHLVLRPFAYWYVDISNTKHMASTNSSEKKMFRSASTGLHFGKGTHFFSGACSFGRATGRITG